MQTKRYYKALGISLVYAFAGQMVLAILAPYFSALGYSDEWISWLFGLFPLTAIFAGIISGELSEQIGRYWMIRVALIFSAVSYLLYLIGSPASIVAGRIIDAACFVAINALLLAKVQDSLESHSRGKFTGIILSLEYITKLIGPIVGGALADRYLGLPFMVAIPIFMALALILTNSPVHKKTKRMRLHPIKSIQWFFKSRELRPMLVLGPCMHAIAPAISVFLPLLVVNGFGLSYTQAGLAISVLGAAHLLQFAFGDLCDRFGRRRFIIAGTALMSVMLFVIACFVVSYAQLLAALAVFGIGAAMWNVAAWTFMSDVAEKTNHEGRMVGTYLSVAQCGSVLAFAGMGLVSVAYGYAGVFFATGIVTLIGTVAAGYLWFSQKSASVR